MARPTTAFIVIALAGMQSGGGRARAPAFCESSNPTTHPSPDLYCVLMVPRPELSSVSGIVELGRADSPFDIAVTATGEQRFDATMVIDHLPPASDLGPYQVYLAWVAPPSLAPMIKLGPVRNGRTHLGEIALDKFVILVSAEASPRVTERTGRLVLRGLSPSIRMQQHGLSIAARTADSTPAVGMSSHQHGDSVRSTKELRWFMPEGRSPVSRVAMPGIDQLLPPARPFLPGRGIDPSTLPEAQPRQLIRPEDGDTLDLVAMLVRKRIQGHTLVMYGYNGQQPGPLIEIRAKAAIVVRFRNAIDLPSAIHWHGIRLENRSDGAPGVTQEEVPPSGTFVYRVRFPDPGIYWYHPHVREDIEQDLGLAGNILVRPQGPELSGPVHREEALMLDDLLMGGPGLVPFGEQAATHALMGRFGNVFLVNAEPNYRLSVHPGEIVRFYLTNVSNTRTFNVALAGAAMKLVAADAGHYERETWVDHVAIGPAQRYIVEARFPKAGSYPLLNQVQAVDHIYGNFFAEVDTLGAVTAAGDPIRPDYRETFEALRTNREVSGEVGRYRAWFDRRPDKELLLTLRLGPIPVPVRQALERDLTYRPPIEWSGTMPMMDWLATAAETQWILRDLATGKENMAIDWRFRRGDVVKIRIANDRGSLHPMGHPIHLHGQRFLVLSYNDRPNSNLVWKDTAIVPVGGTVDLLVEMSNPGRWMIHCHIAEHLESGMMGVFEVQ